MRLVGRVEKQNVWSLPHKQQLRFQRGILAAKFHPKELESKPYAGLPRPE